MQNINTNKFCLITDSQDLLSKTDPSSVFIASKFDEIKKMSQHNIIVADYNYLLKTNSFSFLTKKYKKLIFIVKNSTQILNPSLFFNCVPDLIISESDFSDEIFLQQDEIIEEDLQNLIYLNLASELNSEYENIKSELETRLDETKLDLMTSRQKILDANIRIESMRRILYSITKESDLHRIETVLNELLPASSKATWIKIVPSLQKPNLQSELNQQLNTTFKCYDFHDQSLFFIKGDQKSFKKDDLNLFSKIRDIVEINYSREVNYITLARTENIVRRAFEEFNHPLAVIDSNYKLIQSNIAFNKHSDDTHTCYKTIFNKTQPCENCNLGTKFVTKTDSGIFDVFSNSISIENNPTKLWINLYKNKTEEHYFEQRLNQNAKMKELGIISSSIAHELNNPIGGVLSYLQLVQMDLPKNSTYSSDINSMIQTTLRIKKIIEDLLVFSRTNKFNDNKIYDLQTILSEALSIHEIHFKNENIKIINNSTAQELNQFISKSAFLDALHFIFNFYIERIKNFRKINSQKTGLIEVKTFPDHLNYIIEFQGNCGHFDETEKSKDMSLLALSKCLTDQNMHLEIATPKENWIGLKVIIQKS